MRKNYSLSILFSCVSSLLVLAAMQPVARGQERINVAATANGGTAVASSNKDDNFSVSAVTDGDRKGMGWGAGGGWADGTPGQFPDSVEIEFTDVMIIDEVNVFTMQDTWWNPIEPTESMNFFNNGVTGFQVQYFTGTEWVTIPGGLVTGNTKVWRRFTFAPVNAAKIRVVCNSAKSPNSILIEVEAFGVPLDAPPPAPTPTPTPSTR